MKNTVKKHLCMIITGLFTFSMLAQNQLPAVQAGFSDNADLEINISSNKTTTVPGDLITYTLNYKNFGPSIATGSIIQVNLGSQLIYVSSTNTGATHAGNIVYVPIGALQNGVSGQIKIFANINQRANNGTITTNTAISSNVTDNNPTNNSKTNTITINKNIESCTNQSVSNTGIIFNYSFTSTKHDILLQSMSYNDVVFPGLILVDNVQQIQPLPNAQEISTDRGDEASYGIPNEEDPGNAGIVEYLSNNNLNNLIDTEGAVNWTLDVSFETTMVDNNSTIDGMSELIIFERGMNSDIVLQPILGLGGALTGTPITLNRSQLVYMGFQIDTVEISSPQNLGYRRVDLSQLGVKSLKYLRLAAGQQHSGPDIKILGVKTSKCSTEITDLGVQISHTYDPVLAGTEQIYDISYGNYGTSTAYDSTISLTIGNGFTIGNSSIPYTTSGNQIIFNIGNLNPGAGGTITITGSTSSTLLSGSTINASATIITSTNESNLLNNTDSTIFRIIEKEPIRLSAICSQKPREKRERRIINPNNIDINFTWTLDNSTQNGTGLVPKNGELFIKSNTIVGINTLKIYVDGKLNDTKSSTSVICDLPIADLFVETSISQILYSSGNIITFGVLYGNLGPSAGNGVTVYTNFTNGITILSGSTARTTSGTNGFNFWIGTLGVNQTGMIIFTGVINGLNMIDNQSISATISGYVNDPNLSNNADTSSAAPISNTQIPIFTSTGENGILTTGEIQGETIESELKLDLTDQKLFEGTGKNIGLGCYYSDEPYKNIKFVDTKNHRASNYVQLLLLNCIVKGRRLEYKHFEPESNVTVAETLKIFTKLRGIKNNLKIKGERFYYLGNTPIADVTNKHRAALYVDYADQLDLLDGLTTIKNGKRYLNPDRPITRNEAIKVMMKTYELINGTQKTKNTTSKLSDLDQNSDFYNYIKLAEELGFVGGKEKNNKIIFDGKSNLLRSELSKIVSLPFKEQLRIFKVQ